MRYPLRFAAAYLVLAFIVGLLAVFYVGAAMGRDVFPSKAPKAETAERCASPVCAEIGDEVAFVVKGRVTAVSEPQAGWRCVSFESQTEGAQKCAKK